MVILCKKLVEQLAIYSFALAPRSIWVPPMPPEFASAVDIQNNNLGERRWLFHRILDYYLNGDGQHEIFRTGVSNVALDESLATMRQKMQPPGIFLVC